MIVMSSVCAALYLGLMFVMQKHHTYNGHYFVQYNSCKLYAAQPFKQ